MFLAHHLVFNTGNIHNNIDISIKTPRRRKRQTDSWQDGPYEGAWEEESLWKAVIMQAVVDAVARTDGPQSDLHKKEAVRWLTRDEEDFVDVCLRAGLEPSRVRACASNALRHPGFWRIEAGASLRYLERRAGRLRKREGWSFDRAIERSRAMLRGCLIMYPSFARV